MSILLIVVPKYTLTALDAVPWRVTVTMTMGQTDRLVDARPLDYAFH